MISNWKVAAFALASGALAMGGSAQAQTPANTDGLYASVSGGASFLTDSQNRGELGEDFVTGTGTTIPAGVPLGGAPVGWTTQFDTGWTVSGALGKRYGAMRGELEVAYQANSIKRHFGVFAGDVPLDQEDAGVLIPGSGRLGATVGEIVDDGRGSVDTLFLMANGFYDFKPEQTPFSIYVGGGLGVGFVEVDYRPSNVGIINDDAAAFAYQVMGGASYDLSDRAQLFAGYRFRGTTDVTTDVDLFPGTLDIENRAHVVEGGLRFFF